MGEKPKEDTYKGESPGKKIARDRVWWDMLSMAMSLRHAEAAAKRKTETLHRARGVEREIHEEDRQERARFNERLRNLSAEEGIREWDAWWSARDAARAARMASPFSDASRILVLASREGGDISTIRGHEAQCGFFGRSVIVAVDRCAEAANACRLKWPGEDVRVANVVDVAESESFDAVFLDLCGRISQETIETVARVAATLRDGAILSVAIMRGRERDEQYAVALNRSARRVLSSRLPPGSPAHLLRPDVLNVKEFAMKHRELQGVARAMGLAQAVEARLHRRLAMTGVIDYHSRTAEAQGVPMTIITARLGGYLDRDPRLISGRVFGKGTFLTVKPIDVKAYAVAQMTGSMPATIAATAMRLNIDRTTVAAWKAHATRGTYDKVG